MNRWFHYRFRFQLAEGDIPRWWLDLAVLDLVVREVLTKWRAELALWRLHRRCNPSDEAGHQFTFLAYTQEHTANRIDLLIQDIRLVQNLESQGFLREYRLVREAADDIHLVEGTSDKNWPPEVQKAWPFYIMGVSEMLLDLVHQLKGGTDTPELSQGLGELEVYYDHLAELMTGMWRQFGSHAYLHHLNALFGYQPLLVRPRTHSGTLMTL